MAKRPNNTNTKLLSIKQAVEVYGCTVWYWRERIWAGELPVLRVGRKQLLDCRDIDAFIDANKVYEGVR
jgi:hypothetical protein